MALAIGVIETQGMPSALAVADALGKAAAVAVVRVENTDVGRISVIIRGETGAVQAAIAQTQALMAVEPGLHFLGSHILPHPHGNLEDILPVRPTQGGGAEVGWLDD
jgi:microcompartment protein CcmL/EutN